MILPARPNFFPASSIRSLIRSTRTNISSRSSSRFGRQADHHIKLDGQHSAVENRTADIDDLVVCQILVNDTAKTVGAGLGCDGDLLVALIRPAHRAIRPRSDRAEAKKPKCDNPSPAVREESLKFQDDRRRRSKRVRSCSFSNAIRGPLPECPLPERHAADSNCNRPSRNGNPANIRARSRPSSRSPISASGDQTEVEGQNVS